MIFKTSSGFGELESLDRFSDRNYIDSRDDGLAKFPDFVPLYNQAVNLSQEVDTLRGDPLAGSLDSLERSIAVPLKQALDSGAANYVWNHWNPFEKRTVDRWRALAADEQAAYDRVRQYVAEIPAAIQRTKDAIAERARQEEQARRLQSDAQAAAQRAEQIRTESAAAIEAAKATIETSKAGTAQAEANVIIAQAQAVAERAKQEALVIAAEAQKQVKKLTQATVLGIPAPSFLAVVGLGGAAAWFFTRRK